MNRERHTVAFMCRALEVLDEDEENDNYGIERMYDALAYKYGITESLPTVARVMKENALTQKKKKKPNGLTEADREARKSDDLLGRDFEAGKPNEKWVTDITQTPTADGPLYISGIFDCYENDCVGLAMDDNMRKELVIEALRQAAARHGGRGVILHSDRGAVYTSHDYRKEIGRLGIRQSMNSAGGRCHDNAKCESMWARLKVEKLYQMDTSKMSMEEVKGVVFRYFMGYWNNRRICHANGGLPPAVKRSRYYEGQREKAA